jgi:hypothetical protein
MNTLIEPEGTACEENLISMQRADHWWREESALDQKRREA